MRDGFSQCAVSLTNAIVDSVESVLGVGDTVHLVDILNGELSARRSLPPVVGFGIPVEVSLIYGMSCVTPDSLARPSPMSCGNRTRYVRSLCYDLFRGIAK